ncbi:MAG: hypothetical protein R2788_20850 [Saprospiraceae bacterium]
MNSEQIHDDAEKYEHLLTDEILDEVDRTSATPPSTSRLANTRPSGLTCFFACPIGANAAG